MKIKRIKNKVRFYKLISGYVFKTLFKPLNTSFEVNRQKVNRFRYVHSACKGLRRIARFDGMC